MDQTGTKAIANVYAEAWAEMFRLPAEDQQIYAKLITEQVLTQARLKLLTLESVQIYQPQFFSKHHTIFGNAYVVTPWQCHTDNNL